MIGLECIYPNQFRCLTTDSLRDLGLCFGCAILTHEYVGILNHSILAISVLQPPSFLFVSLFVFFHSCPVFIFLSTSTIFYVPTKENPHSTMLPMLCFAVVIMSSWWSAMPTIDFFQSKSFNRKACESGRL